MSIVFYIKITRIFKVNPMHDFRNVSSTAVNYEMTVITHKTIGVYFKLKNILSFFNYF
ncbi:hypothetical protein D3C73_1475490 [compost metagenome]